MVILLRPNVLTPLVVLNQVRLVKDAADNSIQSVVKLNCAKVKV